MTNKEKLIEYWKTDRWAELKAECLELNDRCSLCNDDAQVAHHRYYPDVLGDETVDALTSLCNHCHHNYHRPIGLKDARDEYFTRIQDKNGFNCQVCDRKGKINRVSFNKNMAVTLCWMVSHSGTGWIDVQKCAPRDTLKNNNHAKMKHWGLLEGESGTWRVTERGLRFVDSEIVIPKYVLIYNDNALEFGDEKISISQSFGKHFNYQEVLKSAKISVASVNALIGGKKVRKRVTGFRS